jgi:hypothetical protein
LLSKGVVSGTVDMNPNSQGVDNIYEEFNNFKANRNNGNSQFTDYAKLPLRPIQSKKGEMIL